MSSGIVSSALPIEYRNVPGFDGYRVDIHGGVWTIWGKGRSAKRNNPSRVWKLLRPGIASNGYLTVSLSRGSGCETRTVHSLVLEAFVGPPPAGQLCRHKDGSYTNCRLDNLEYGTQIENMADADRHGKIKRGADLPQTKLSDRDVETIIDLAACGISQASIAIAFSIDQSHVSKICRNKRRRRRH